MKPEFFDDRELAGYLHLTLEDIQQRVKYREIPFQSRGRRVLFCKSEIDAWASQRILHLSERALSDYHRGSTRGTAGHVPQQALLPQMMQPAFVAPAMTSKTKASVLRDLTKLAEKTGRLNDPAALLESLVAREGLCSTAIPGGIALPHPRGHDPYLSESSFIVAGRTVQPINFGAPDGEPTELFFLICCHDDRLHLHTLARLCRMAQKTDLAARIAAVSDPETFFQCLITAEQETLAEE
jgi:mannitol/fructose-specific phosphotransferase system IIA component (Ntr-type)